MHTITDESIIEIDFPILDKKKYFVYSSPDEVESELEGDLSYEKVDSYPIIYDTNNYEKEINETIKKNNDLTFTHHFGNDFDQKIEISLKDIIREAFMLGLQLDKLNDFVKFLMSELLLILNSDLEEDDEDIYNYKNELIGRYFAYND